MFTSITTTSVCNIPDDFEFLSNEFDEASEADLKGEEVIEVRIAVKATTALERFWFSLIGYPETVHYFIRKSSIYD